MARIRSIKPEFWTSEQVMACAPITRLLFIGIWNFADDAGRLPMSPKSIKAKVFPSDEFSSEIILGMLQELTEHGLIRTYTVDGEQYLLVTGWSHQRIDKPQPAKYPPPPSNRSKNAPGTLATEGKGKEGIGEEGSSSAPDGARLDFGLPEPAAKEKPQGPPPSSAETDLFRRGKEVLGQNAGGMIARLLKAKGGNVALARAAIEQASTKSDAREYVGAIVRCDPDKSERPYSPIV